MTAEQKRNAVIAAYKEIIGRNNYSQTLRDYCYKKYKDGKYYSDCSSSISYAYKKAGYSFGILNTVGMYTNKNFTDVPVKISKGIIQNPSVLRIGDMLLFAGNDKNRKYAGYVGHVEMVYSISGGTYKICGHGSGNPSVKNMNDYCKSRYNTKASTPLGNRGLIKVVRSIQDDTASPIEPTVEFKILKNGSTGTSVKTLQENLMKLGYKLPKYGADGDFGSETVTALKAFQKDNGLEVDGEYGEKSDAAMHKALKTLELPKTVVVTGGTVNVRSAPNTSGKILGTVKAGATLEYQCIDSDGWHLVIYNKQNAWISGKYTEIK